LQAQLDSEVIALPLDLQVWVLVSGWQT